MTEAQIMFVNNEHAVCGRRFSGQNVEIGKGCGVKWKPHWEIYPDRETGLTLSSRVLCIRALYCMR